MSCTICQTKFSFFTREVACPGCGFSCCGKCLKYASNLPNAGKKKVCGRCFNKQRTAQNSTSNSGDMNDAYEEPMAPVDVKKKLDSLENPAKPPIVMYKQTNHWDRFKSGLEPVDQEIVDRLRKLKEEDRNVPLPSVEEIRRRLALLKDEDPDANGSNHRINIHHVDTRSDQQKTDDLIQEYLQQLELSSGSDPVTEIQSRLRSLRDEKGEPNNVIDDDETSVTKKLIAKALAEAALEKKYEEEDVDELVDMEDQPEKYSDDEDEKPSCVTCDQTHGLIRCSCCQGDLYCPDCYEVYHDKTPPQYKSHD